MARFAVSVVGRDRPGIVAAVTGVLADHGGNLLDSTMTTLHGHFAIVLVVELPGTPSADAVANDLAPVADRLGLVVGVQPAADDGWGADPSVSETGVSPWVIVVHGADRPGIVHAVARTLADAGASIVDLTTRVGGTAVRPVYSMTMRVAMPDASADDAVRMVRQVAHDLDVHCTIRRDDADIL
jgi:glycine cleavage system transcriptional repressor